MLRLRNIWNSLLERAASPVDAASLAAFRILFGSMMFLGVVRFAAYGWIDRFFVSPEFYFTYWGFSWVKSLGDPGMYWVFGLMGLASLCVAVGLFYRVAIATFFALFTYVELIDVSNYLNHYYLVSLLAFLLIFLPANRLWSLDAYRASKKGAVESRIPAWMLWWLRFQVACVYVYAGLAKFGEDWLVHAQPLNLWLSSRVETPVIGPLLGFWETALFMSWAGFLFDTTIVGFLMWKRTRPWAYLTVIAFHLMTNVFFAIGLFPIIMIVSATAFFEPDWPRRFFGGQTPSGAFQSEARLQPKMALVLIFCLFQALMPWRHLAYPGDVLWTEEGMRWSWKVMVRQKKGDVMYRVKTADRVVEVSPGRYLNSDQEREMSSQPDLILQLAHHIADEHTKDSIRPKVYADVWVSLNGRRRARLIDPTVDLARLEDTLWPPAAWILPSPDSPPFRPFQK